VDYTFERFQTAEGTKPLHNFFISLDLAKILAASCDNAQGRAVLQYLINNPIMTAEKLFSLVADIDLDDVEDMFIYAIRDVVKGDVKLGISKNPLKRLKQLQTANANVLEIAAIAPAPNRFADERRLHQKAAQYHIRGEWFENAALALVSGA
jgi:hypothetical protein